MEVSCKAKAIPNKEDIDPDTRKPREVDVPISVNFDFGETLGDMMSLFGDDTVFHQARSSMTVALQSALRSWVLQGLSNEEILNDKLNSWEMPSGKARGRSRIERLTEEIGKMSAEDKAAFLESVGLTDAA